MTIRMLFRLAVPLGIALAASACARPESPKAEVSQGTLHPGETPELRQLIRKYSHEYDMPESLLHQMVQRESGYNPAARNGPYMGLLQIHPKTAQTMGFTGKPTDLLDAETNLKYAGKYLRGAWLVSDGSHEKAERWYANGYYYEAKRRGLLAQTGLN